MNNILKNLETIRNFYDLKHQVISNNISNANIAGKKAKNVEFDFSSLVQNNDTEFYITHINHINFTDNKLPVKSFYPKGEKNINGNNINLKEQTEQLTENAENIKIANDLYKQMWKISKIAIGN